MSSHDCKGMVADPWPKYAQRIVDVKNQNTSLTTDEWKLLKLCNPTQKDKECEQRDVK